MHYSANWLSRVLSHHPPRMEPDSAHPPKLKILPRSTGGIDAAPAVRTLSLEVSARI